MMIRMLLVSSALLCTFSACAGGDDGKCASLDIPGKHFIYVAGTDLKRISTESMDVGRISLPQKRDVEFFVVTSPDLTADALPGGRDVEAEIRPSDMACKRAKVYRLDFSFGSLLPPGPFSIPFPIFSRNADGMPGISAHTQNISGSVDRIWMKVSVLENRRMIIRNEGNLPASKLKFPPLPAAPIRISTNRCEGVALKAGESCEITFDLVGSATDTTQDWKADYSDTDDYLDMRFSIDKAGIAIFAMNKFYE